MWFWNILWWILGIAVFIILGICIFSWIIKVKNPKQDNKVWKEKTEEEKRQDLQDIIRWVILLVIVAAIIISLFE